MLLLVAIALLLFLPSPWSFVGFIVAIVLWLGELFLWNRTVKGHRKAVGAQTLIGQEAVVVVPCLPEGQVRVDGELWQARCEKGAQEGKQVRIVGRRKLTLIVEPAGG
jgi:membrane protein implicated in regulation of membrane protease activity